MAHSLVSHWTRELVRSACGFVLILDRPRLVHRNPEGLRFNPVFRLMMTSRALINSMPDGSLSAIYRALVDFANRVDELRTPADVLDGLHVVSSTDLPLNVLAAARFSVKAAGVETIQLGKSGFLHKSVPDGWWEEYTALAKSHFTPMIFLARSSLASFTWTETTRQLEPIGADRWSTELGLKYGMRDGLTYGVGGMWVVAFWSRRQLSNILPAPARIPICAAASVAALRLEQLSGPDVDRIGTSPRLTPRELAVLRMVSMGHQSSDIAKALGLGEETVRSHLKKAQAKLGARNRSHAACDAVRHNLIP
jgi:DNA-binding CsgD family transcriptional regulator